MTLERSLSTDETAHTLGISRRSIYRLRDRGEITPTRIGERVLFHPADVHGLIERGRVAC